MAEKDKMSSKRLLDLDFSDIEGEKDKKEIPRDVLTAETTKKKKKKENKKLSGYILTFKHGNRYVSKDLVECTSEEFLQWAKSVYPDVSATAKKFDSISARARAFMQIQQYHLSVMTREEREAKH